MRNIKFDIFEDIIDFASYAQGVDRSVDLESIYPSYEIARDVVIGIISKPVYEHIAYLGEANLREPMKKAIANYTMYEFLPFLNSKRDKEAMLYKYQVDLALEQYHEASWSNLDKLLVALDSSDIKEWKDMPLFKQKEELQVKSAVDFNYYYNIDNSSLFFYKTLYLQREVLGEVIQPKLGSAKVEELSERIKDLISRLICYYIVAKAVETFEKNDLPPSIKKKLGNEFSKDTFELERVKLTKILMDKVDGYLSSLDRNLLATRGGGDLINYNSEKNKFYLT